MCVGHVINPYSRSCNSCSAKQSHITHLSAISMTVLIIPTPSFRGRDSSVGIATRYRLDGPGIQSRWGARFSAPVQTGPGAHPASCTMGTGSFPGVKSPARGVDHPPPSRAEVEGRVELYICSPSGAFVACSREKFTFYLLFIFYKCLRKQPFVTLIVGWTLSMPDV